uniref:Uncharacterized protein n=1 Tax=Cannabis sativa TaxID=3483 RepID=A0A803PHD4_CANSA
MRLKRVSTRVELEEVMANNGNNGGVVEDQNPKTLKLPLKPPSPLKPPAIAITTRTPPLSHHHCNHYTITRRASRVGEFDGGDALVTGFDIGDALVWGFSAISPLRGFERWWSFEGVRPTMELH